MKKKFAIRFGLFLILASIFWLPLMDDDDGAPASAPSAPRSRDAALDAPPPPRPTGDWVIGEIEDPVTGDVRYTAILEASNETRGHLLQTTASLVVRCQSNRTEVYVDWDNYLDGNSGDYRGRSARDDAEDRRC